MIEENQALTVDTVFEENGVIVDISSATEIIFKFESVDDASTAFEKTGSIVDGPAGLARCEIVSGLLNPFGLWKTRAIATLDGEEYGGKCVQFIVYERCL